MVLVLDTCVLIYDSLAPGRLTAAAASAIKSGFEERTLSCSDISLWELAMLVEHGRLKPGTDTRTYIDLVLQARDLAVLPITPEVATLSASLALHRDPAARIVAATAICHSAHLVTSDKRLIAAPFVPTLW